MGLFIKKPFAALQAEANESGNKTLKRVLGPWSLIALGVGVIIGAGLFSITGTVAAGYTGPAITLSFAIAAIGCCFAGLCYAEFASMIPVAGSAYTYSYATMGELIAWIIGWDLVLEYTVAATTVSISWSRYLVVFLEGVGINIPHALAACPWDGGIVNIPAALIVVLMSIFLIRGTEGSSIFNGFIVFLKVAVILIFVVLGWKYINAENYVPYIPANTGTLGEFGFSGVLRGAAIVFFAFLGFDAVSTAAQETKNPKRDMPVGILGSLLICTILYMVFAYVMTGVAHYSDFAGQQGIAPVAVAIDHMGHADATGVIHPDYPWLNRAIVLAILFGYCSVIMVTLLGQSRVFLSMSRDGLLPPFFSKIHEKYRTPAHSNLLFMVIVGGLAAFVPARVAGEMTSIGILDKDKNVIYPGGKYEKAEIQLLETLRTIRAVPSISAFINRYKRKVCLMSYLIKPDQDSKVSSAQKSFGRYKLIESRETGENGALLEHPSINAEGFEFRRISHEYSFRLS